MKQYSQGSSPKGHQSVESPDGGLHEEGKRSSHGQDEQRNHQRGLPANHIAQPAEQEAAL